MAVPQIPLNLDLLCAKHAQIVTKEVMGAFTEKPAEKAENLITRTLGVLQGQGVYAAFLWLSCRSEKEKTAAQKLKDGLQSMVASINETYLPNIDKFLAEPATNPILSDIPTLLLVKRTMERALTYARYHAKAQGGQ